MKRKEMKKVLLSVFGIFLITMVCLGSDIHAKAEDEIVRFGYFDLGDYYQLQPDGTVDSYDGAFLNAISPYTNFKIEYIDCGTWNRALEMLNAHEIDLVGTMQWTAERENQYEICDSSYGYSVAELAALPDSPYIYEDFEAMNGLRVGCIEGYVIKDQLQNYMDKQNLSMNVQNYPDQSSLVTALESGEIDLIAANAHAMQKEWNIIAKISYGPCYFATWKGNEQLAKTISEATVQTRIHHPGLDDTLIEAYFPQLVNSPYTKAEMDCINQNVTYDVYFDSSVAPLVWHDEDTDTMQGVLVDICNQLEEKTGLRFEVKQMQEELPEGDTTVAYRTLFESVGAEDTTAEGLTSPILNQVFEMYHNVGDAYMEDEAYRISIVKNRDGLQGFLEQQYPNCTVTEYDTPEECMAALVAGHADLTFLSTSVADRVIIEKNYDQIAAIPLTDLTFGIALQFYGENAKQLAGIVDKGIGLLDETAINDMMVQYAMQTAPDVTVAYLIKQHFVLFLSICTIVVLILLTFAILFTYAKVMKQQKNRVESANQARSDFFARMSHDMRTPMNGILGMIALSKQTDSVEEIRDNMDKAEAAGHYMLSLINDTLDLQRLESGKMQFNEQTIRTRLLIEDILELLKTSAEKNGIRFQVEEAYAEDAYIRVDSIRVSQIFTNLISNAIKFTPRGGTIGIRIESCPKQDDTGNIREHFLIQISDSGVGMSEEFIGKHLFQVYAQEENVLSNQYAGSGLGLAIVKNLVDCMGGEILVDSEIGVGTSFTVKLDFEKVETKDAVEKIQNQKQRNEQVQKKLDGIRVLVCEDQKLNAEIVIRLLEKAGCEVAWAENGKKGVALFLAREEGFFDAILMDIRMPVMDGIAATKQIRSQGRIDAKTIPIIALSANAYEEDVKKCMEAGMNEHLAKPIQPTKIYEIIARYVNRDCR